MAVADRGRTELSRKWTEREASPERTKVWTESAKAKRVAVVYYLSRNGQLEHPHFMEVTLSSRGGLYLRDVINRLDFLRGKGMATLYSWSSKRSYRNGFVWHDLSEDDFIYPAHGQEYVLKGSEILPRSSSSPTSEESAGTEIMDFLPARRKKIPWSSLDLGEYKAFKSNRTSSGASVKLMDEGTQTDNLRPRQRESVHEDDGDVEARERLPEEDDNQIIELDCDEISPPPSSSTSETLGVASSGGNEGSEQADGSCPSGGIRASASAVLMHLISCGAISTKGRGGRLSRPPRDGGRDHGTKEMDSMMGIPSFPAVSIQEKEYFSGSLVETRKKKVHGGDAEEAAPAVLKRSSSYSAERTSKTEMDGVRARCIPSGKTATMLLTANEDNTRISRSEQGSKRID